MSKASALINIANDWLQQGPSIKPSRDTASVFSEMLASELGKVFNSSSQVAGAIEEFNGGAAGGSIEKTAFLMAKAEAELRLAVQVRNKVVSAYQDVMNLQI